MLVGLLFCAAFVTISFFAKEQPDNNYVLIKADKLVRTAGTPLPAKWILWCAGREWNLLANAAINRARLNCQLAEITYLNNQKATMSYWHHTTVDRPDMDGAVYAMGWTISGLAVLGTIVAVWILGI
jgi:hypothetical protein